MSTKMSTKIQNTARKLVNSLLEAKPNDPDNLTFREVSAQQRAVSQRVKNITPDDKRIMMANHDARGGARKRGL
jgi:hypothetical protein